MTRPFDAEAAKRGEPICYNGRTKFEIQYVSGPDPIGYLCLAGQDNRFFLCHQDYVSMAHLAQVEGKDVYPGDVLYYRLTGAFGEVLSAGITTLRIKTVGGWVEGSIQEFSWTPPTKTERRWMFGNGDVAMFTSRIDNYISIPKIARIRINGEWHDISEGFEVEVGS